MHLHQSALFRHRVSVIGAAVAFCAATSLALAWYDRHTAPPAPRVALQCDAYGAPVQTVASVPLVSGPLLPPAVEAAARPPR